MQLQHPKVSILMPSLNSEPFIRECMETVVNQTLQDIEIICVDAGSTDGTLEILREYERNERCKYRQTAVSLRRLRRDKLYSAYQPD